MSLKDELTNVAPEAVLAPPIEAVPAEVTPPDPAPGSAPSTGEAKPDRPVDNAVAEFNRKFNAMTEQISKLTEVVSARQSPPAAPQGQQVPTAEYTLEQLRAAANSPQVTPQLRQQIQEEIAQKIATETTLRVAGKLDQDRTANEAKSRANAEALALFKGLNDPNSQFYQEVDREFQRRSQFGEPPTIVLDSARAVADRLGIIPQRAAARPSYLADGRTSAPAPSPDRAELAPEKYAEISSRLASALPKGKTFDANKIADKFALYKDNAHLYTGKIGG